MCPSSALQSHQSLNPPRLMSPSMRLFKFPCINVRSPACQEWARQTGSLGAGLTAGCAEYPTMFLLVPRCCRSYRSHHSATFLSCIHVPINLGGEHWKTGRGVPGLSQ